MARWKPSPYAIRIMNDMIPQVTPSTVSTVRIGLPQTARTA